MDDLARDLELIGDLLRGTLTPEEKKNLEQRLMSDPDFKKIYDEQRLVQEAFVRKERSKLWDKITAEEKNELAADYAQKSFLQRFGYWAMAASVALLAMVALYWWQNRNLTSEVFLTYYQPVSNLSFPKSRGGSEAEETLQSATTLYNEGSYSACVDTLMALDEKDDRHYYVLGLTSLALSEYEEAISFFDTISPDFEEANALYWYKALAFAALGKQEDALEALTNVHSNDYPVQKLREALNK